jgi:hypothetical protein
MEIDGTEHQGRTNLNSRFPRWNLRALWIMMTAWRGRRSQELYRAHFQPRWRSE